MSNKNSRHAVDRFLSQLGESISEVEAERATAAVLDRLHGEDLRKHLHVATPTPVPHSPRTRVWAAVAAAAVLIVAGGLLQMLLLPSPPLNIVANSIRGGVASQIQSSQVVRAGGNGAEMVLLDGSHVEMGSRTELSVIADRAGLRVRLASGTVLVTATKQTNGRHLYVETKDCLISVVGTVFAVNAEEAGSRISVLEGEVHVQRGEVSQMLVAGQEASTSPQLGPLTQERDKLLAGATDLVVLEQSAVAVPKSAEEVVVVAQPSRLVQNNTSNVMRGFVKNATSGEGIADVTVSLCPQPVTVVRWVPAGAGQQAAEPGVVIRDKTFFFSLWDRAACTPQTTKTDSTGRFQFGSLADGEYIVAADRDGYMGPARVSSSSDTPRRIFRSVNRWNGTYTSRSVSVPLLPKFNGDIVQASVNAQQPTAEISLSLIRGGIVSGHVRESDGNPVMNAVVRIVSRTATGDGPTVTTALTNSRGEYEVYGLAPGDYRAGATFPNGVPTGEVWFSRSSNPAEIAVISLHGAEEVSSIDIVLPRR